MAATRRTRRRAALLAALLAGACAAAACEAGGGGAPADAAGDAGGGPWTVEGVVAGGEIGADGGLVRSDDLAVTLSCGPGAVAAPTAVAISALRLPADDWLAVPGAAFLLEPADLALAAPCVLSVAFDPAAFPHPAQPSDFALFRHDGAAWVPVEGTTVAGALSDGPLLTATAFPATLGAYAVRVPDPYAAPPVLDWIGLTTVLSDASGPKVGIQPGFQVTLNGRGFGWDASVLRVTVGGQEMPNLLQADGSRAHFQLWLEPPPAQTVELPVQATVKGRASNVLTLRVLGQTSCALQITNLFPRGSFRGGRVRVRTDLGCGLAGETLEVRIGGRLATWEKPGPGDLVAVVPPDAPLGATWITVADGLGGPESDPWPFVVLPTAPPALSPGLEADGVWTGYTGFENGLAPGASVASALVLGVDDLEPRVDDYSALAVRFTTEHVDTGFVPLLDTGNFHPPCAGISGGRCVVVPPAEVFADLAPGDPVTVRLRVTQRVHEADAPPDGTWVRESAPLTLTFRGSAPPGSLTVMNVGHDFGGWYDRFCAEELRPLNVGDTLCLWTRHPEACISAPCAPEDEVQTLRAPALWDGPLDFSESWPPGRAVERRCFPLVAPGVVAIENLSCGVTCEVPVVRTGGRNASIALGGVDPSRDLVVAAGGARLVVPAGALPDDPDEGYAVEAWAPLPGEPGEPSADPQRSLATGTFSFKVTPEPPELLAPVSLTVPFDPDLSGGGLPELAFLDPVTGAEHLVDALVDAIEAVLAYDLPAGPYRAPTGPQDAVAMSASFNTVAGRLGVAYRAVAPGILEDLQGRCRVDHVTDPASPDHADEIYASTVLTACTAAWDALTGLGWRVPDETVQIVVRASISWADFSGAAKGATGPGYLGQPTIAIKSSLGSPEVLAYIVAHEVGHLFQREYTVNLTVSWLDEAMGEWAAWKALGPAGFRLDGMTEDCAGVLIPTLGFADSWGTYAGDLVYGTQVFTLWAAWKHGDDAIRKLYEALDWSPTHWASPWATFQSVTGKDPSTLMKGFAEDFWLQRFEPVKDLDASALLATCNVKATAAVPGEAGLTLDLAPRPPLSSLRYRVDVPAGVSAALQGGDAVLTVASPGLAHQVQVWHEPGPTQDPKSPSLVGLLGASKPTLVLPTFPAGIYWVLDDNYAPSGTVDASLRFAFPRLTGLSPAKGGPGTPVVATGHDLGAAPGTLRVGGQDVPPTSWSATSVAFTLPAFANTQAVTVRVLTADGARTNEPLFAYEP